jgi:hypothetical protein
MKTFKGENGVLVGDNGETWRAFGSPNVTSPQPYEYKGRDDKPTGVWYGMGFDKVANGTRIAYVDYPKSMYSIEEIINGEDTPNILMRCNVCHAMDQAAKNTGRLPYENGITEDEARRALTPRGGWNSEQSSVAAQQPRITERLSAGPVMAATLPKYLTYGIKIGKAFGLRPTGDVAVSLGLSFLADLASGFTADPSYKRALQAFSDDMIDTLDPDMINRVKQDALDIAEAAFKDGDALLSKKRIMSSIFKTRGDLKKEMNAANSAKNITPYQNGQPSHPMQFNFSPSPGALNSPRLFE